jgi:hypothetical protein
LQETNKGLNLGFICKIDKVKYSGLTEVAEMEPIGGIGFWSVGADDKNSAKTR